jgi:uncharacterized protein YjbJ (UPF0337 family)
MRQWTKIESRDRRNKPKLETEGKTDKAVGAVQNAVGGLKDTLRGK